MEKEYICRSVGQTEDAGRQTAAYLDGSGMNFTALYGELGAGKTAFTRGFTSYFVPDAEVMSPTYSIVNVYGGRVFHFDMYRIKDEDDLYSVGFYDYDDGANIIITEWSENIGFALPERYVSVTIEKTEDESVRRITVRTVGDEN